MTNYIKEKLTSLKELGVLSKMTAEEKRELKSRTTEISADNYARTLILKYLR